MSTGTPSRWRLLLVALATVLGMAATARLGFWQLDRAAQKIALQQSLDQRSAMPVLPADALATSGVGFDAQNRRATRLQGRWLPQHAVYLDNRQMDGRPGFYVIVPLRLEPSGLTVAVQRGWLPRAFDDRTRLPPLKLADGVVTVSGHIAPAPSRLYEFAAAASGAIRQNLDLREFAGEIGAPLAPFTVVEDDASPAAAGDGLGRRWPAPALGLEKHYGYAFQWFALCALMAILYVWFRLLRPRFRRPD